MMGWSIQTEDAEARKDPGKGASLESSLETKAVVFAHSSN